MNRRGFSLIELLVVIVMIGIMTLIGYPRIQSQLARSEVRAAAGRVSAVYAQGRANAIQTGQRTTLNASGNQIWLSTAAGMVGSAQDLEEMYGVGLTASEAAIEIDARGLTALGAEATFVVARDDHSATIAIGPYGNIIRR